MIEAAIKAILSEVTHTVAYWLPSLAGGVIDYLNQLQRGAKRWSIFGFFVHLISAVFFGVTCGSLAEVALHDGLIFSTTMSSEDHSITLISASAGMGGFLGVRLADLITYVIRKK